MQLPGIEPQTLGSETLTLTRVATVVAGGWRLKPECVAYCSPWDLPKSSPRDALLSQPHLHELKDLP